MAEPSTDRDRPELAFEHGNALFPHESSAQASMRGFGAILLLVGALCMTVLALLIVAGKH